MLTEIGARFALGSTTIRTSPDDRLFDIVAYAEPGYSIGVHGTLWRWGWLRLQAELLYSSRQTTLDQTTSELISAYRHPGIPDVRIELSGSRATDFARPTLRERMPRQA